MTDFSYTVRPDPLTDDLKARVAGELGQLAALRDNELGLMRGGLNVQAHSNTTHAGFLDTLKEIFAIQNAPASQQNAPVFTSNARDSYVRG